MDRIIVDTSSILFALSNKVDIFAAVKEKIFLEPVISRGIITELSKISAQAKARGKHAGIALDLIKKHKIIIEPDTRYVDSWILSDAKPGSNVCTNDTKLRNALKGKGVRVYVISRSGEFR